MIERELFSDELVERHLDAVLRAGGSGLRYYSLEKSRREMRAAMRAAMAAAVETANAELTGDEAGRPKASG